MLDQRRGVGRRAGFQHDDRLHALHPLGIGHADHRAVGHGRVLLQATFHLGGVDVLGAGLDHLHLRADEAERPVGLAAPEVVGAVPAVALALRIELGPAPVAVHHRRAAHADLAHFAGGKLHARIVEDSQLRVRRGAAVAAEVVAPAVIAPGHRAHHLGLPVAEQAALGDHRNHRVPLGADAGAAQAVQLVAAVAVELGQLVAGRLHQEGVCAAVAVDRLGDQGRVAAADEDVAAADVEHRQRHHQRADVEQRAGIEKHRGGGERLDVDQRQVLPEDGGLAQHRAVRAAAEGRGIDDQRGAVGVDVAWPRCRIAVCDEVLVAACAGVLQREPQRFLMAGRSSRGLHGSPDLAVLPDHDARLQVVDHEAATMPSSTPTSFCASHRMRSPARTPASS